MATVVNPLDYLIDDDTQVITLAAAGMETVIAAGQTDLEVGAVELRQPGVVKAIVFSCTTSSGGATRATVQVTDGTNDLMATDPLLVSAGSIEIDETTTPALVVAQQARAAGDRLQVDITTVASETVTGFNCQVYFCPTPRDS